MRRANVSFLSEPVEEGTTGTVIVLTTPDAQRTMLAYQVNNPPIFIVDAMSISYFFTLFIRAHHRGLLMIPPWLAQFAKQTY